MATSQDFKFLVLQLFFNDIHRLEQDNYAPERYSFDGVDRSQLFDVARHVRYMDWFMTHADKLFDAYCKLEDEESRNLYVNIIRYKLAGHLHVRIDAIANRSKEEAKRFKEQFVGVPSALVSAGMFGNLVHYDREWEGTRYTVDTLRDALVSTLIWRQYYFERHGVRIAPERGDFLIDGGACTGDTTAVFAHTVGPQGRIYAFDPVSNHLEILRENFSRPGFENVTLFPYGLSDRSVEAPPVVLKAYDPGWRVTDAAVPLARVDDLVMRGFIEKVDFIKLDVEGSEMATLRGATASIHRFRPKLAISIYHKPDDFYEIIEYVAGLGLGYRLFLDHHTIWDEETVLYATV
jgi:FkbM family methyltransferase